MATAKKSTRTAKSTKTTKTAKAKATAKKVVKQPKPTSMETEFEKAMKPQTLEAGQAKREADFAKCQWINMDGKTYCGTIEINAGIVRFVNCLEVKATDSTEVTTAKWFEAHTMNTLKQFTIVGANCTATMSDFSIVEKADIEVALIYIRANVANLGSSIISAAIRS